MLGHPYLGTAADGLAMRKLYAETTVISSCCCNQAITLACAFYSPGMRVTYEKAAAIREFHISRVDSRAVGK